jgi:CBS domain-containing protein
MKVGQLCTRTVAVARGHEKVVVAARRMRDLHVGSLVIVEDTDDSVRPVGLVTDRDLLFALVGAHPHSTEELRLEQVVATDLVSATEDEDVSAALERMKDRGVRRLPVVDEHGILQGIFAYDDHVEWMAEQLSEMAQLVANEQRRERGLRA